MTGILAVGMALVIYFYSHWSLVLPRGVIALLALKAL